MGEIFPATAARVAGWGRDPDVVGVVLVGSKSRGHDDALSDDDLEVFVTPGAFARRAPADCIELLYEGEGDTRRLIFDAQITTLEALTSKRDSPIDLDHWPYESAPVLFDRDGSVAAAVARAGAMDDAFRRLRLQHATLDTGIAARRAVKTLKRGWATAGRSLVARGARGLTRLAFALEGRWTPLDHWLDRELATLTDADRCGPAIAEALATGHPEPLLAALERLEPRLTREGVPPPAERLDLFVTLLHPTRADERARHGLT